VEVAHRLLGLGHPNPASRREPRASRFGILPPRYDRKAEDGLPRMRVAPEVPAGE